MNNDDYIKLHQGKKLNLETGIRCTLQCPDCARTIMMKNGEKPPGRDLTIKQFNKLTNFFKEIHFCGGWSDPIFNPDFIKMLKLSKEKNVSVTVHTAASHKSKSWFQEAFEANTSAEWIFGIDGLPEESHKYRINQDGIKLFDMMILAKNLGIYVKWQYLIFDYNRQSLPKAKELAKEYNITMVVIDTPRNNNTNRLYANENT